MTGGEAEQPLADLDAGMRGRITRMSGRGALVQRLLEMGLTEGTEVEVVRFAPLGDPMEIRVRGYYLSLRKHDAQSVQVERIFP